MHTSWVLLVLLATLIGFNYGANLSLFPSYAKDLWGMKHFGFNYGVLFTAWGFGGLVMGKGIGGSFRTQCLLWRIVLVCRGAARDRGSHYSFHERQKGRDAAGGSARRDQSSPCRCVRKYFFEGWIVDVPCRGSVCVLIVSPGHLKIQNSSRAVPVAIFQYAHDFIFVSL